MYQFTQKYKFILEKLYEMMKSPKRPGRIELAHSNERWNLKETENRGGVSEEEQGWGGEE